MARLQITVDNGESVRATLDDGSESPMEPFRMNTVDRRMVGLFEDWLAAGYAEGERKLTRRKEFEVLGMLLYRALFPEPVSSFFERTAVRFSRNERLRVELSFRGDAAAERLASLPWEFLYRPDTPVHAGYFLSVKPQLVLSRYLPLDVGVDAMAPADPPLRILATAAKPEDLGIVREAPTLEAIARLPMATVEVLEEPTFDRFLEAVERFRPHVVHVIAHGRYDEAEQEGAIALVDDAGYAAWVPDSQFADGFEQTGWTPHVVNLHACEGATVDFGAAFAGLAPKLIRSKVQAVVAMQYPVTNRVANAFSTSFYDELGAGRPVDAAVQTARFRITATVPSSVNTGEFGIPVLYMRSSDAVLAPGM
jgi:CHAT domain